MDFLRDQVAICYLLSLSVIARKEFRSMSCYKLMLTLGILDVICVTVSSELTGYFYYIGFEYCMLPTITYICGCWMNFFFNTCCMLCFFLVFNRFVSYWKPYLEEVLFAGYRTWLFVALALAYGLIWLIFPLPVLFNFDFGTWIYYPMIQENPPHEFKSVYQVFHNVLICGGIILFYFGLYVMHMWKMHKLKMKNDKAQMQILVQASLVCLFTFITAITWIVMLFVTPTTFILHVAHGSWQLMHGTPAFVYLFLNKTIQHKAIQNLRRYVFKMEMPSVLHKGSSVAPNSNSALQLNEKPKIHEPQESLNITI